MSAATSEPLNSEGAVAVGHCTGAALPHWRSVYPFNSVMPMRRAASSGVRAQLGQHRPENEAELGTVTIRPGCHPNRQTYEPIALRHAIKQLPEVVECHLMAGECDALLRIVTDDPSSYRRFHSDYLTRIGSLQSVKIEVPMEAAKLKHALHL
jgi:Lrp/AsnC ligand binding domain